MLSYDEAKEIAKNIIIEVCASVKEPIVLLENKTIEKEYAWIFFYNSEIFIEAGDVLHALGGNSPIFVSKKDGRVSKYSTGYTVEKMIEIHEEENKYWSLILSDDTYSDVAKLKYLKDIMQLPQSEVSKMKSAQKLVIDQGSQNRLENLKKIFKQKGIETVLFYNNGI